MAASERKSTLAAHYRTLNVPPGAGLDEIKSAYRHLAREWHPDRHRRDPRLQKLAEETLKAANHAYRELSNALAADRQPQPPKPSAPVRQQRRPQRPGGITPVLKALVTAVSLFWRECRTAVLRRARHERVPKKTAAPDAAPQPRSPMPTQPRHKTFGSVLRDAADRHGLRFHSAAGAEGREQWRYRRTPQRHVDGESRLSGNGSRPP